MLPCPDLEVLEDRLVPSTVAGTYGDGVWRWDSGSGWGHLTTQQASQLAVDDAGNVFGVFTDGLWRWDAGTTGWAKLSGLAVEDIEATGGGVLYGDFGTAGTWRWSFAGWQKISAHDVNAFAISDNDTFFGDYGTGTQGTWRWTPTQGWLFLSPNRPDSIQADASGNLIGVYVTNIPPGDEGTWRWTPAYGWLRFTDAWPGVYLSESGTLYEDRGINNLWRSQPFLQYPQGHFFRIGGPGPYALLTPLSNGDLMFIISNAGTEFLRVYHLAPSGVETLPANPAVLTGIQAGKAGDAFFDAGNEGTWYWNSLGGYVKLGNSNPILLVSQG